MLLVFSHKLAHIPNISAVLGDEVVYGARHIKANGVLGWGHKPTADKARRFAKQHGMPYIAVEDGFLRSVDLGVNGAAPLSLVVDYTGIYYDATMPSDLENLLNDDSVFTPELERQARLAMDEIIRLDLSKYNHAPAAKPNIFGNSIRKRVLLLDQTKGDASVTLGLADGQSFLQMVHDAEENNPNADIFVKTHPDVLAGKKQGYLTEIAKQKNFTVIAEDVSPLSLLAKADEVYCVTSQMGFEACMLGKSVHCYGMPFYAGWGLTHDTIKCERRIKKRTAEQVFAAAYLLYAKYIDPIRGELTDIHATIRRLVLQREKDRQNAGFHACFGYSGWKHPHARAFLQSSHAKFAFYKYFNGKQRAVAKAEDRHGDVVAWSSKCIGGDLEAMCRKKGIQLIRMEDGFIRSVGLGSNFQWPYSLVLDRQGIYYDPRTPSDLENILNSMPKHAEHDGLCKRAALLRGYIVEKGITKYNVGQDSKSLSFPTGGKRILLVPGQVEDDASVRSGGCAISSNLELLKQVRRLNPDAYIIYKPHPDVEVKNRKGRIEDSIALNVADTVVRDIRMDVLLGVVDEVHTLTSLTGFEALLRNVRVTTYGGPFYAGWGLTDDCAPSDSPFFARRKARLSLDELVAGVLLLYPSYYDWQSRSFCSAEDVCYRLLQPAGQMKGKYILRLFATLRRMAKGIKHG